MIEIKDTKTKCPHFHTGWQQKPVGIVIHYTASGTSTADIDWFLNPTSKVSCHFYIDREGNITRIVNEHNRSWHAGKSDWLGMSGCNNFMLGIELDNLGKNEKYPEVQIESLIKLTDYLIKLFPSIDASCIVGHSHISPGRKIDPGPLFPWESLDKFVSKNKLLLTKSIQSHIERLGYEIGSIDGAVGPKTKLAINEICKKYKINYKDDFELLCALRRI